MLISDIINDSFGLLSKQLKFYCWQYKRDLDQRQRHELINLLNEHHFERLASKIKSLNQSKINDCRQQIGKLLFDQCIARNSRHQLKQLIESELVDIDVRLDNYGRTLLHRTASNLDVELVKLLIDHGVNIRLRDYAGNTALHIAIQSYRNGALIYNNEPDVVANLTAIIRLLLEADKNLDEARRKNSKKIKLSHHQKHCQNASCQLLRPESIDATMRSQSNDGSFPMNSTNSIIRENDQDYASGIDYNPRISTSKSISGKTPVNLTSNCQAPDRREQSCVKRDVRSESRNNFLLFKEDFSSSLIDTENAFGRTALHYCVLVVGEKYLSHIVELLIRFGANSDAIDTRLKTPLYCLVKRSGISAIKQRCLAIGHLINSGCDDLGLAIESGAYFTENLIKDLEKNVPPASQDGSISQAEPIFVKSTFKRVPSLKHLARLQLIKLNDERNGNLRRQTHFALPKGAPLSLNAYVNRRILDQSELF